MSSYERVAQEEDDDAATLAGSVKSTHSVKPAIYYDSGPFDVPSSEDEDEDEEDEGVAVDIEKGRKDAKRTSLRFLVITLGVLVSMAAVIGVIAAHTYVGTVYRLPGVRKLTMDHVFNGTFWAAERRLAWVGEAGDGVFSIVEEGEIRLVDLERNETRVLVRLEDVLDEDGRRLDFWDWKLSPDTEYLLFKAHHRKQWRWSSFGNYYVHSIADKSTWPIGTLNRTDPKTAYATWAPTGQSIAYVESNDLYVLPTPDSASAIRLTTTGSTTVFNGVPDWVYEEEVFSGDHAVWWSPTARKLVYLSFDETEVPVYAFPVYNPTGDGAAVVPYPGEVKMRYPKPGYANPTVGVWVWDGEESVELDLGLEEDWEGGRVVQEVRWVGEEELLVRVVNRNADDGGVWYFDLGRGTVGREVRRLGRDGEEGDEGWIEPGQTVYPLEDGYLDIVPTKEGWNHVALFSPANATTPVWLTGGEWEVTSGIKGVDVDQGLVYFEAAAPSSVERHLYAVSLEGGVVQALTDTTALGYYSADFSPGAGWYLLSYHGPDVPWQKVVQAGNSHYSYVLESNERLGNVSLEYESATVVYSTIDVGGVLLNAKEIRPPHMDDSGRTKYAVLFRVYGGPNSQLVDVKWERGGWDEYLACGMGYVVVIVDGRGTGARGRAMRGVVKGQLGELETLDQVGAAKVWAAKDYVDPSRIGIWGWSYGGFMSAKVVEANAGIHSLAMSVAPVTSWRLYDSIYTERYMNLPALNPSGYATSEISNVTGWGGVDYLLAHGSADDNVHFSNSARLLDMFTDGGVRGVWFRMFTDSDHSISRRGAKREVYEYMTGFLADKWGKGGRRRGW
ncbi:dipeptidyl aminopeptidase [Armillaria nabsnona]|nr:dipeptidyl aminopeptidase [Armillaria nabsnona]